MMNATMELCRYGLAFNPKDKNGNGYRLWIQYLKEMIFAFEVLAREDYNEDNEQFDSPVQRRLNLFGKIFVYL
jgi:hypothetical protein